MAAAAEPEVQYVRHRYERSLREDGRRCHTWCLIDDGGTEHTAVVGIETDTLDGHYAYTALEPFASKLPLNCGNQAGVAQYLDRWLSGQVNADDAALATFSGGGGSGGAARRKAFSNSLCSSRAAVLDAASSSPLPRHAGSGRGRGRGKSKGHAAQLVAYTTGPGTKQQRPVGIVQQNQIKKARKYQEDVRAEHERLVAGHLHRLQRAAAAEQHGDATAKQVTLSWMQGSLTGDEREAFEHWCSLLSVVLDLQQQAAEADSHASEQQHSRQHHRKQKGSSGAAPAPAAAAADPPAAAADGAPAEAGAVPAKLLAWLQQPENNQHHLRVMLECLRELGSVDVPARLLLQNKVIALVQRCRCEQQHEAVRSVAGMLLARWRWQLSGHMQVLCQPKYMTDHAGELEEEVAAGLVPLPQLPQYKQAVLSTQLPMLPGGAGSRSAYTPSPSHLQPQYRQHHMLYGLSSSAQQLYDPAAAGYPSLSGYGAEGAVAGYGEASAVMGMSALSTAYYTPMPSLSGVQGSGSPAVGGQGTDVAGQQQQHQLMLYGQGGSNPQLQQLVEPGQHSMLAAVVPAASAATTGAGDVPANSDSTAQGWQVPPADASTAAAAAAGGPAGSNGCLHGAQGSEAAGAVLGGQQAVAVQQQ